MTFPSHLEYLKEKNITWFNPCWGYYGFWKRMKDFQQEKNIDFQTSWLHRDMKRNKERYAVAMAALCMQQDSPEKNGWWFTKILQDPPDGLIGAPREYEKKGNLMRVREVEVVEYFGKGSLLEIIKKKLDKKSYEPNTILVCLLSPEDIENYDFRKISKELIGADLPLIHIFVLFHGFKMDTNLKNLSDEEKLNKMLEVAFVQLSPIYNFVSISPLDCCANFVARKEAAWLKFSGRGMTPGFCDVTLKKAPILFD